MKTLLTIFITYTIIGWIIRYRKAKAGKYKINPLDEDITLSSGILVSCTFLGIVTIIVFIIIYLP